MSKKMTDEALAEAKKIHEAGHAWNRYVQADLLAHIAALTAERDEARGAMVLAANERDDLRRTIEELHAALGTNPGPCGVPSLVEAAKVLRHKADVADMFRERVRTLEERITRLHVMHSEAKSHLSAIRQRVGDEAGLKTAAWSAYDAGESATTMDMVRSVARYILGGAAPAEPLAQPPQTDDLGAIEQWRENQEAEARAEPTMAEAFATLEKGMQEWGRALENDPVERKAHAASRAALSLLERRMGAMARALQRLEMFLTGPTRHDLPSLDEVRTALTDAPAVFTLDEVEEAVGHVLEDWQNEWTVDEGKRRVRELLTAFRE
jgi:DNA repair exonuclease SbcCD ATPase subunit